MDLHVNGKRVTLRDRLPAKANWDLLQQADKLSTNAMDFDTITGFLTRIIESWELPGDPAVPASYAELDLFSEMMPLMTLFSEWMQQRMPAKN